MIGKALTARQMEKVLRNLGGLEKPWNCPHGRPTMRHVVTLGRGMRGWKEGDGRGESQEEEEEEEEMDDGDGDAGESRLRNNGASPEWAAWLASMDGGDESGASENSKVIAGG
jgi:hypothetical protein